MDLNTICKTKQYDQLLTNGNWQKADFYTLETSSSFWNKAIIITLPKAFAKNNSEALIYLLQKQSKALQIWESEWSRTTPTVNQFMRFFIAERGFTTTIGKEVSTELFYKNYIATINGITAEPSFEFSKNEKPKVYVDLLDPKAILNVICFDVDWQEHNYLIETETHWVLYHWNVVV
jgi:hypothetical protein